MHPVESLAQTIHFVESLLQTSLHAESLTTKIHHVKSSALLTSYSVERSARKQERAQLENVTLWRVQLQTNHTVERSDRRSHLVEGSAVK